MSRSDELHAAFEQLKAGKAQESERAFRALLDQEPPPPEARYGLIGAKLAQSTWTPADGSVGAALEQIVAAQSLD